jgi:phosphatidylglycerol:prolipoprotein diacylglycerol transferase
VRSTLFHIPAQFAGVPIFGFGWLLLVWALICIAFSVWLLRRPDGRREIVGYIPFFFIVAAVFAFLLPNIVEYAPSGKPIGLPIRGYGVMLMLATVSGVALAAYRAWQVGIDPEVIYSLAFVMFIGGILGARLFYILEYWNQFVIFTPRQAIDWPATFWAIVNVTKGGLVVYGSFLLGVPAGIWFCRSRDLPVLAIGDIIAPSLLVGLALGRIGCFLNGCCFGGICLTADYAVTFPADSPPYIQQEEYGWDSGLWLTEKNGHVLVAYVDPQGPAKLAGLKPGDEVTAVNGAKVNSLSEARQRLLEGKTSYEVETADGRVLRWLSAKGPPRSVPVHPTQLYAAIDAGLLALVLWFFFPYRRHDGEVFALLVTVHPISRFLLEMIRSDEPGQFGTGWTISQWISLGLVAAGIGMWIYIEQRPRGSALPRG